MIDDLRMAAIFYINEWSESTSTNRQSTIISHQSIIFLFGSGLSGLG